MSDSLLLTLALAADAAAVALFLFCCFAAASDAQGAFVFLFLGPVIAGVLAVAFFVLKRTALPGRAAAWAFRLSGALAFFFAAFFACSLIPPLRAFPGAAVGAVARAFEAVAGKSPYQWVRDRDDMAAMIARDLSRGGGRELDFSRFQTAKSWSRLCVFGPYTDSAAARAVLGLDWDIQAYSKIAESDGIDALVFLDDKKVAYVTDLPRSSADFAKLSRTCFPRREAVFERSGERDFVLRRPK